MAGKEERSLDELWAIALRDLTQRGLIDRDMLAWGKKVKGLFVTKEKFFFGIKGDMLMVVPFESFTDIRYHDVRYYSKEEVSLQLLVFRAKLTMHFRAGNKISYSLIAPDSVLNANKIIAAFSVGGSCTSCPAAPWPFQK
jgi:hypothetical protein